MRTPHPGPSGITARPSFISSTGSNIARACLRDRRVVLDGELDLAGLRQRREQVHREHRHQRHVGRVRLGHEAGGFRHLGDAPGAGQAADVADVGLDDVDGAHRDHAAPLRHVVVLLAALDVDRERARHFLRPLELPVGARLLERGVAGVLEPASHRDRDVGRVAAVRVGVELDVGPDGLAHRRNDRFAAARRRVAIAAAGRAEPDLERLAAELVAEPRQPRRLVGRD